MDPEPTSPVRGVVDGPIQIDSPNVPRTTVGNPDPSTGNALSHTSMSSEKLLGAETLSRYHHSSDFAQPILPLKSARLPDSGSSRRETRISNENRSPNPLTPRISNGACVDWVVPLDEKQSPGRRTVGERLQPTLDTAIAEKDKSASNAKWTGYALNAAIGAQVLLGSLTTGLSALSVSGGASTAKATTAIGALATLVASYLARARGSNEPESSIARTKDLDQFIRECRAFQMDHGHMVGDEVENQLLEFRHRFEELLGNVHG